jgi:Protein of unknown function (DUF2423)
MAKGARASTRKRNNAALRSKIFGPASDARTERLSAKLQELVSKPKPAIEKIMEVDSTSPEDAGEEKAQEGPSGQVNIVDGMVSTERRAREMLTDVEMDLDGQKTVSKSKQKPRKTKIEKKKATRKARNSIVFPSLKRKRQGPGLSKGKR